MTNVCFRSHSVAVGDRNLWSVVPAPTAEQTRVLLERARGVPLTVTLPDREDHAKQLVKAAIQRGALVRSLRIQCQTRPRHDDPRQNAAYMDLKACLHHPAPELEDLFISSYEGFQVPVNLFNGTAPKLRHLSFSGAVFLPQHWPFASGLRSLHLDGTWGCSEMDLFLAVQAMTGFERLTLKYKLVPAPTGVINQDLSPVQLPYLTHLLLAFDDPTTIDLFVTYLVLPKLVSLKVESRWSIQGDPSAEGILVSPVVRAFFQSHAHHIHLARLDIEEHCCRIQSLGGSPQSQDSPAAFDLRLGICWRSLVPVVKAFLTILGACTLEELSVCALTVKSTSGIVQSWTDALGSSVACCTLRKVHLKGPQFAGFFEALGHIQPIFGHCTCASAFRTTDAEALKMVHFLHRLETVTFLVTAISPNDQPGKGELLSLQNARITPSCVPRVENHREIWQSPLAGVAVLNLRWATMR
jgi:hypothetical protein